MYSSYMRKSICVDGLNLIVMQQPTPGSHWRHYKSDGTDFHTYEVI